MAHFCLSVGLQQSEYDFPFRSKSSGGGQESRSSCCEGGERGDLCRHAKASQSTRSTRWEVYQHVGNAAGRQGALYQVFIVPYIFSFLDMKEFQK